MQAPRRGREGIFQGEPMCREPRLRPTGTGIVASSASHRVFGSTTWARASRVPREIRRTHVDLNGREDRMEGGIGALILVVVALGAGVAVMLLTLNARWKSVGQQLREARRNAVGATLLVLLALVALSIAAFVVSELL